MDSRQRVAGWAVVVGLSAWCGCTCEEPAKPSGMGDAATSAPAAEEAAPEVQEAAPKAEAGEMTDARMLRVARGEEALGGLVDRTRGLVVVERYEDPSGEDGRLQDGWVSVSRRLCGEPLELELARLARDLRSRSEVAEEDGEALFRCEAGRCAHAGLGEYDVEGSYHFEVRDGRLVLDRVWRLASALITEEVTASNRAYIESEVKRLAGGTCAGGVAINAGFYRVCNTASDRKPGLPLREEPSWDSSQPSLLGHEAMQDGRLVEDLGSREGEWWRVRVVHRGVQHEGWVQGRNREAGSGGEGLPTLCPVR